MVQVKESLGRLRPHGKNRKKDAVSAPRVSRAHWRLNSMQRSSYVGIGLVAYRFSMCSSRYSRSMEIALSSMRRATYQPFADLSKDRLSSFGGLTTSFSSNGGEDFYGGNNVFRFLRWCCSVREISVWNETPFSNKYDDFGQVVKHEKLGEGDFEVESSMSFGGSLWCQPMSMDAHRSTDHDEDRSMDYFNHRSTSSAKSTAECSAQSTDRERLISFDPPTPPIDRRAPLTYRVRLPSIDSDRINALRPPPKPLVNPPEPTTNPSDTTPEPMKDDEATERRRLRKRKEKIPKNLKREANEKEMDGFTKRVLRIPVEKPFDEVYYTHRLWMFFRETKETEEDIRRMFHHVRERMKLRITLKKKSDPGKFAIPCVVKGTSIDIKVAAFEKEKGNIPIPSRDPDGHTRAMDGIILQVSREDIADILQLANGPDNLAPSPSIDRRYECGRRAYEIYGARKFRWEQKDEYGVYRDESGYGRSVAGEMIPVTKDNIRKILERASLFEGSHICLPEHATSFTPAKVAPEIYTKDEINEMVTGICGAQEKLGDELKTLVDDTYQPLDRGYNELFRSMAQMRTEIESMQHILEKEATTSPSIDANKATSIDTVGSMSIRYNLLVCMSHIAPIVAMKALPSNREEFQLSLMSKTRKSTGTRALPICTSSLLMNPPEFL
ncbi:hypothetical protein F2Q70_00043124 [Brassica cretica]|uniref:Uncharacterized protein n=1 Tax=Brassica cretica TaxID=69181 RepID=A0A8S9KN49_BRACR|nr:hypothetical protein F2Q70_00043124 [Brassica cretica]